MRIWIVKKNNPTGTIFASPFKHLHRMVTDKFDEQKITFPFSEIEIELAYNLSLDQENKSYNEWYEKLPIYYRGKNLIRIAISAKNTTDNLETLFELLNSAFEIILKKKKKTDEYNSQQVINALLELKQEMSLLDLWELDTKYENILRQEQITSNLQDRQARENTNVENKRLIRDIRLSDTFGEAGKSSFMPYSLNFCDKIVTKLREVKFRLPNYDHLYIIVSDSFENALFEATRGCTWFVYGVTTFEDYENYEKLTEKDKKRVVFDLIKQGLHDIAKVDNLDILTLDKMLDETEKELFKQQKNT